LLFEHDAGETNAAGKEIRNLVFGEQRAGSRRGGVLVSGKRRPPQLERTENVDRMRARPYFARRLHDTLARSVVNVAQIRRDRFGRQRRARRRDRSHRNVPAPRADQSSELVPLIVQPLRTIAAADARAVPPHVEAREIAGVVV
jgi:hypothetical protein